LFEQIRNFSGLFVSETSRRLPTGKSPDRRVGVRAGAGAACVLAAPNDVVLDFH
jgi:hypothetical protein